jgi:hypothetical protein
MLRCTLDQVVLRAPLIPFGTIVIRSNITMVTSIASIDNNTQIDSLNYLW